jgi:hypothetical protein
MAALPGMQAVERETPTHWPLASSALTIEERFLD